MVPLAGLVACSPFCLLMHKAWQVWVCIQRLGRSGSWCLFAEDLHFRSSSSFYWENSSKFVMICCLGYLSCSSQDCMSQAVPDGTQLLHLPAEHQSEEKLASIICTLHQHQLCEEIPQLLKCSFAKAESQLLNFLIKMLLRDCTLSVKGVLYVLKATGFQTSIVVPPSPPHFNSEYFSWKLLLLNALNPFSMDFLSTCFPLTVTQIQNCMRTAYMYLSCSNACLADLD